MTQIDGSKKTKALFEIVGGVLALDSDWTPPLGDGFENAIQDVPAEGRLNLGCVLRAGSFRVCYEQSISTKVEKSKPEDAFIVFFLNLLDQLQVLGNAPAMIVSEYSRVLKAEAAAQPHS